MKLSMFLLAGTSVLAATAVGSRLRGTVDYSFDEGYRIVRTDDTVFLVRKSALSAQQLKALDHVGSQVALELPPGALAGAWTTAEGAGPPAASVPAGPRDSISAAGSSLRLSGTLLPAPSEDFRFLQIGGSIFGIRLKSLPSSEQRALERADGRVVVKVPRSALRFAWKAAEQGLPEPPRPTSREPDRFEVAGDEVEISGTALLSFDEKSRLVQSGGTFFQLKRSALEEAFAEPGSRVRVKVPASAISFVWSEDEGALPDSLLQAISEGGN